ncbi:MAG: hypothetical protein IKW13_08555, partial [Thermoguttaceae bacterium]|nr:hypothetical protein [Thermoguttaceae bacterium]
VDADNQNYRLKDDALATNAGNNDYFNGGSFNGTFDSFDLDGARRVYYSTTDMGAFENQNAKDAPFGRVEGSSVTLNVTTGSDVVDTNDGKTSLREALALSDRLQALGYDSVTIRLMDDYTIALGDAAYQINSPVTILGANATINCDYSSNAFLIDTDGEVVIENFEIKNGVGLDGGAIKMNGGELTLVNVLMNNCEATVYGGALYVAEGAKATLYNVTAAKNVAVDGAGVYGAAGSTVAIYNSVIAANRSATSGVSPTDVYFAGTDFELAYVLVGNAGTAANASKLRGKSTNSQIGYGVDNEIDPRFIAANDGNFRLSLAGSPAVGAGSSDYVYGGRHNDLDGSDYGFGGYWIPGENEGDEPIWVEVPVSMGAYQVGEEAKSTVVTTLEDVVNAYDGLISLREALSYARDAVSASGAGSLDGSAYAATNAMNTVYSATVYSAVTFDPSLAGGTIVLNGSLGSISLGSGRDHGTNSVYDYVIDASSLSGLGGITIDASQLGQEDEGGNWWRGGGTLFEVHGRADTTNGLYWPVHLDLRNVRLIGDGGTGVSTNSFAMVSMRSCLIEGFDNAVTVGDDDSADGGIAHIYSSTLIGNVRVGGKAYVYNSIITGELHVQDRTNDPAYRTAAVYNSYVQRTGGLTGRISSSNVILGGSINDLFVDAANGDYRLARYSLAVNGGDGTYLRTLEATHAKAEVDLNGNLRVDNAVVDMGAYESQKMVDVPSTKVTTELDVDDPTDGLISIREALAYAVQNSTLGKTVTFDASLDGKTIVLDGALELTREVNFNGGDVNVTLSGGGKNSIFSIALNADDAVYGNVNDFTISNLTLTDGYTTKNGGAIEISRGNVRLNGVDIYGCSAGQYGGAIYAYDSELTLENCRIGGNAATYYGGVVNQYGSTVLLNCYIAENVGATKNSDVWGYYPQNYANSKNNVIGFVQDVTIVDGQYGNRVGTATNPLKPFVNVSVGNLEIKPETAWGAATPTTPPASASVLDDAFAAFVDEEDAELAVDLAVLEETVFDDDLFASFEQF